MKNAFFSPQTCCACVSACYLITLTAVRFLINSQNALFEPLFGFCRNGLCMTPRPEGYRRSGKRAHSRDICQTVAHAYGSDAKCRRVIRALCTQQPFGPGDSIITSTPNSRSGLGFTVRCDCNARHDSTQALASQRSCAGNSAWVSAFTRERINQAGASTSAPATCRSGPIERLDWLAANPCRQLRRLQWPACRSGLVEFRRGRAGRPDSAE